MLVVSLYSIKVYAADANIVVSSTSVEEGKDVSVTVSISSTDKMAAYNLLITYDATVLEYTGGADGGGNGALKLLNELFEDTTVTRTLTFKTKKAGTVAINVDATGSSIIDMNIEDCKLVVTNGTVTVTPHVESSNNNFLSNLEVQGVREDGSTQAYNITQRDTNIVGFDKNQTKYMGYVANDIVKFAVTAVPEDNTATVNISGVELAEGGANVTTITVTAQNGEVREYVISTYRVPSEEPSEETTSEPESESESETTPPVRVDKEVTIGNDIYVVSDIAEETILPEGFSKFNYVYDGQEYIAAKGEAKRLTIMQLVKKGTDEKALYVYDSTNNVFYKFVNIQVINKMYTVTEKPDNIEISNDFEPTLVNVEGEMLNIWANKNEDGIYLFYGMNWNGESGLYLYDSKEKTVMRYLPLSSAPVSNQVTPKPNTGNINDDVTTENTNDPHIIIMVAEGCVIAILLIVLIIVCIKKNDPDENDEEEIDEKEDEAAEEIEAEEIEDEEIEDEEIEADETEEDEEIEADEEFETESAVLASAIEDIMEEEQAEEEGLRVEETPVIEETPVVEENPVIEETPAVEEALVEEEPMLEEQSFETEVAEEIVPEVPETVETVKEEKRSVEELLMDSSTSLNDEELDFVLDKLLGDD